MSEMSIREFQKRFANGEFNNPAIETQCEAGWYDWFCKDSALAKKTQTLGKVVAKLTDSKKVNLDTMYVFFKNNCPCSGPVYDDFRICDMAEGNVLYCISLREPWDKEKNMWNVHAVCEGKELDDLGAEQWKNYKFKTTKALVEWLNEKE